MTREKMPAASPRFRRRRCKEFGGSAWHEGRWPAACFSALRRVRVVPVRVLVADAAVRAMNDDLAPLVDRDFPRSPLSIGLRRMDRGGPVVSCAAHGPFVTVRNDMLVFTCH